MPDAAESPQPLPLPEYDWAGARRTLIFYFSRRSMMNAEDLAQETLTRLLNWLNLEGNRIQGESGFMKTVYGFARNVLRESLKARTYSTEELPEDLPLATNRTRGLNTPEAIAYLRELLQHLPERDRKLIVDAEEVAQPELAEQMRIPLSTLRVWLHRAREKLRELEISNQGSPG